MGSQLANTIAVVADHGVHSCKPLEQRCIGWRWRGKFAASKLDNLMLQLRLVTQVFATLHK